jgi:hypothetical protein
MLEFGVCVLCNNRWSSQASGEHQSAKQENKYLRRTHVDGKVECSKEYRWPQHAYLLKGSTRN